MKIRESALAHKYLDGLVGIEIGAAAHNPFGLDTLNVDKSAIPDEIYQQEQLRYCGEIMPVDIVANGDSLPFEDSSWDFIVSSHVLEHFYNPIKALKEWHRVVKPGGYIFMIVPHKDRTFDHDRPRTTLSELLERNKELTEDAHHNVWITEDVLELCSYLGFEVVEYQDGDDKIQNGFTVIIEVKK